MTEPGDPSWVAPAAPIPQQKDGTRKVEEVYRRRRFTHTQAYDTPRFRESRDTAHISRFRETEVAHIQTGDPVAAVNAGLRSGEIPMEEFTWQGPLSTTSGKTQGWRSVPRRLLSLIRRR